MADRQDSDPEVLTSLPRSRPVRRSAKRAERRDPEDGTTAPARGKPAPEQKRASTAKGKPAAKGKPPAKKAKPASKNAKPASKKAKPTAKGGPTRDGGSAPQPRVRRERNVPPAGYAAPSSRAEDTPASGTAELIGTTFQAAAELTQIGLTIGRQTLRSMLDRLPKP